MKCQHGNSLPGDSYLGIKCTARLTQPGLVKIVVNAANGQGELLIDPELVFHRQRVSGQLGFVAILQFVFRLENIGLRTGGENNRIPR